MKGRAISMLLALVVVVGGVALAGCDFEVELDPLGYDARLRLSDIWAEHTAHFQDLLYYTCDCEWEERGFESLDACLQAPAFGYDVSDVSGCLDRGQRELPEFDGDLQAFVDCKERSLDRLEGCLDGAAAVCSENQYYYRVDCFEDTLERIGACQILEGSRDWHDEFRGLAEECGVLPL